MEKVLPIVVICGIGIVVCISYIVAVSVKALRRRPPRKRQFEIDEDTLVIKLNKRRK